MPMNLSFHPVLIGACLASMACLAVVNVAGAAPPDRADNEAVLRAVAGRVVRETTRRLVDTQTGRVYQDSGKLPVSPHIRIESKFNAWFYQTWLLADGMRRTAAVLEDPAFGDYGERNLDFIYRNLDFLGRQHAAGVMMEPIGDGNHSPIGFFFEMTDLWHTGLAPLVMERHAQTKDRVYEPYLGRMSELLEKSPRFEDGIFYRAGRGLMVDDAYMTVPFLLRKWRATGDARLLDSAVSQVAGTHRLLLDKNRALLKHIWDLKIRKPAGVFWGRGNGWMVLAQVELLEFLPLEDPRRAELIALFVRHMDGIRRCQDPSGGWHQVLDHPESWIETSCTGMFVYGLARGVNEGWLDASFAPAARTGFEALKHKVTPDGDVTDVCGSTGTGDLQFYLNRPRLKGDLHGFGSFLLAGAEVLRMERATNLNQPK
jgi:rhamnogalacturonyl hydrolase YesR